MGIRRSEELVKSQFHVNDQGWPTGGVTTMAAPGSETDWPGFEIRWQDGIIGPEGQNGAFLEDVLEAARQRLRFFQSNENTRCRENAIALTHIETALAWLDMRTRNRLVQGVENTYKEHSQ